MRWIVPKAWDCLVLGQPLCWRCCWRHLPVSLACEYQCWDFFHREDSNKNTYEHCYIDHFIKWMLLVTESRPEIINYILCWAYSFLKPLCSECAAIWGQLTHGHLNLCKGPWLLSSEHRRDFRWTYLEPSCQGFKKLLLQKRMFQVFFPM